LAAPIFVLLVGCGRDAARSGSTASAKPAALPPSALPVEMQTPPLRREQVRQHVKGLIREQLQRAKFNYGNWPARIDYDGAQLKGAEREEFLQRGAAAETNGHAVIAVQVRGRWFIYDERAQPPGLSPTVNSLLTEADRTEINRLWWSMEAEIWARREAYNSNQAVTSR
jgi:hypothetical protein